MSQPSYKSDLTDQEWQTIEHLLPAPKPVGSGRKVDLREVLNAIFYRADNGIKWRALPCDFPAWQTVYGYYRLWVRLGVWEQINTVLVQQVRSSAGREPQPSLVIIDSQSVKLGQKAIILDVKHESDIAQRQHKRHRKKELSATEQTLNYY